MKYLNVILIVYSLLISSTFGATITDDTLKVGKPGSSANKEITLGTNQKIRANQSTGKLEFSNDGGALYKNLGSGSGSGGSSGINILANDSFEDGIGSPWTSSGGTFTQQTYTVGAESDTKYGQFVATTSGQYIEQIVSVPTNFSVGCQADFKKVNIATAGQFKIQALDASNNILAEQSIGISAWVKVPTIAFPCPAAGTNNLKLRLTSLSAGTIQFDRAYIGSNQGLVYSSQSTLYGGLKYPVTNNCNWTQTSSTYANFPVDTDCGTATVSGKVSAPATKIPGFTMASAPAGTYLVVANGFFTHSGGTGQSTFRLHDGTTGSESQVIYGGSGSVGVPVLIGKFTYATTQSNLTIQIQALTPSGTNSVEVDSPAFEEDLNFSVYFYPLGSEVAISPEQLEWYVDANIGGANVTSPINVTSYTEITNASLDLVLNSGSALAEIPCSATNPSTGLTCAAGSESVGIAFTPPMAGRYQVCFSGGIESSGTGAIQLVETANNAQAIIQEGNERLTVSSMASNGAPVKTCANFRFNSVSKRTIRLMAENNASAFTIKADRSSIVGQQDIHFTVENITFGQNRPMLTGDQLTVPGATKMVTKVAIIGTANCSALTFYGSSWLTYVSGATIGGGCNYTMSGFSARPVCKGMPEQQNSLLTHGSSTVTATSVQFRTLQSNTFANVDTITAVECTGPSN